MSEVQHRVCTVTIIEPGMPDKVIKITPALHEKEKIWLDNTPGIERWKSVQQLMRQYCPKGRYVPDAAYWHQPGARGADANILILTPDAIPVATLDGAVFEPLPGRERAPRPKAESVAAGERVAQLEARLDKLTDILLAQQAKPAAVAEPEAAKRGPGRPKKTKED